MNISEIISQAIGTGRTPHPPGVSVELAKKRKAIAKSNERNTKKSRLTALQRMGIDPLPEPTPLPEPEATPDWRIPPENLIAALLEKCALLQRQIHESAGMTADRATELTQQVTSYDLTDREAQLTERIDKIYEEVWYYLRQALLTLSSKFAHLARCRALYLVDLLSSHSISFRKIMSKEISHVTKTILKTRSFDRLPDSESMKTYLIGLIGHWDELYSEAFPHYHVCYRYVEQNFPQYLNRLVCRRQDEKRKREWKHNRKVIRQAEGLRRQEVLEKILSHSTEARNQIESIFEVLFPRLGEDYETSPPTADVNDDEIASLDNVNWEFEEDDPAPPQASKVDNEDDEESDWEEHILGIPYTITLSIPTNVADMISEDNRFLVDIIRETATQSVRFILPRLNSLRRSYQEADDAAKQLRSWQTEGSEVGKVLVDANIHFLSNKNYTEELETLSNEITLLRNLILNRCKPLLANYKTTPDVTSNEEEDVTTSVVEKTSSDPLSSIELDF